MSETPPIAVIRQTLATRSYAIYTAGNAVSLLGMWMQRIAVGWLIWELTGSGAWLGALAFADLFPTVIIAPLAGAIADRVDQLRLVKIGQAAMLAQSLALFALTANGFMTPELLLALTVFLGIASALVQPARMALVPSLVARDHLPTAVAINATVFNLARLAGPAAAGALIVFSNVSMAFLANALSFLVFLVALGFVRPSDNVPRSGASDQRFLAAMFDGFRFAAGQAALRLLFLQLIVVSVALRPVVELLPGFAEQVFAAGAQGLALLTSAIGAGALVGSIFLAGNTDPRRLVAVTCNATLALSVAILCFVATDDIIVGSVSLAAAGAAMISAGVGAQSLLQLGAPRQMRGRVLSCFGVVLRGGPAIGALGVGIVSDWIGLRLPIAALALLAILFVAWLWRRRPLLFGLIHDEWRN